MATLTMDITVQREPGVGWAVVSRALPGQSVSGDLSFVGRTREGVLLAVIDGLGHGEEATRAAQRAAAVLAGQPDEPVVQLLQRCHQALRDTRGVAMTLVSFDRRAHRATTLGVGNVEAVIVRASGAKTSVLLRSGVVGYQLPALQHDVAPLEPGDLVLLATDGVREDFAEQVNASDPLPRLLERIAARHFRVNDDALALACRILEDDES